MIGALHLTTAELLQMVEQWPPVEPLPPEPEPELPVLSEADLDRLYEEGWRLLGDSQ